jgi:hypothetical protein
MFGIDVYKALSRTLTFSFDATNQIMESTDGKGCMTLRLLDNARSGEVDRRIIHEVH